jgi:hypothetical protein
MEPLFHGCNIFILGSMDGLGNFSLEYCFTSLHHKILIPKQSCIILCLNAPIHDYNQFYCK